MEGSVFREVNIGMCQSDKKVLSCLSVPTITQWMKLPDLFVHASKLSVQRVCKELSIPGDHELRWKNYGWKKRDLMQVSHLVGNNLEMNCCSKGMKIHQNCFWENITKETACNKHLQQGTLLETIADSST